MRAWVIRATGGLDQLQQSDVPDPPGAGALGLRRSEEHTSELQSQSISYAVFCLKKKIIPNAASPSCDITQTLHPCCFIWQYLSDGLSTVERGKPSSLRFTPTSPIRCRSLIVLMTA